MALFGGHESVTRSLAAVSYCFRGPVLLKGVVPVSERRLVDCVPVAIPRQPDLSPVSLDVDPELVSSSPLLYNQGELIEMRPLLSDMLA